MDMIIQLPYALRGLAEGNMAKHDAEISEIKRVLEPYSGKHEVGVQIYAGPNDWRSYPVVVNEFESLLDKMHQDIGDKMWEASTLHLPFACRKADPDLHLACDESIPFHAYLLDIAHDKGMNNITLHADTIYYMPLQQGDDVEGVYFSYQTQENLSRFTWGGDKKNDNAKLLSNVCVLAQKYPHLEFGFENMPVPIIGDTTDDPRKLRIDPNLVTMKSLDDFVDSLPHNVGLCFDMAHYILARETLNYYADHPDEMSPHLRILIGSLDPGSDILPNVDEAADIVHSHCWPDLRSIIRRYNGSINDLQFQGSDSPVWKPRTTERSGSILQEGNVVDSGSKEALDALAYLKRVSGIIRVSIDVSEDDYTNRKNQEKTLNVFA